MRMVPRSTEGRAALGIAAVAVALIAVTVVLDALVPSPGGPRSSSFATASDGIAAWADLARRSGREVRALRERVSDATLPAGGTVVVLDPEDFTGGQARALRRFAEGGGRVVAGGRNPGPWIEELAAGLEWERGGEEAARVLAATPETDDASELRTAAEGHWAEIAGTRPVAASADGPIVVVEGRIALVADPSPLQNRLLAEADNAALALALAGPGPITFVESVHGYGAETGLAALPDRFQWALDPARPQRPAADRRPVAAARAARAAGGAVVPAAPRVRRCARGDARAQPRSRRGGRVGARGSPRAARPPCRAAERCGPRRVGRGRPCGRPDRRRDTGGRRRFAGRRHRGRASARPAQPRRSRCVTCTRRSPARSARWWSARSR